MWHGINGLIYGGHDILVFIAYVQTPPLSTHAYVSRGARVLNYELMLFLIPYFSKRVCICLVLSQNLQLTDEKKNKSRPIF